MFLLFSFLSLFIPIITLLALNGQIISLAESLSASLGLALLLFVFVIGLNKISARLAIVAGGITLLLMIVIRILLGFLYDFSGNGFSGDFFAHINRTSLNVVWGAYQFHIIALLGLLCLIIYVAAKLIRGLQPIKLKTAVILFCTALSLSYAGANGSPEILLAQAYARYSQAGVSAPADLATRTATRKRALEVLKPIRSNAPLPPHKSLIQASLPARPLNLILVYLESFNAMLTDHPRYPGLTPRIGEFKHTYQNFSQIYSSAFVTIEGIANSQCGTLFNMDYANNSLTSSKGRLTNLACLGDILQHAGYQQTFLGGADLAFAGKGAFLRDHGYDSLRGYEYWADKGYQRHEKWGLADNELFDQALLTIKSLHKQTSPFNLTLLTLGTHIPGYVYDTCPIYTKDDDKQYLNAIHCTDYLLGKFVDQLEDSGVLRDTLLFVQADHGVFQNNNMKDLFGNHVYDSRLLTLMALPHSSPSELRAGENNNEGSSLNTVATLLNNLNISHNIDFILGAAHTEQVKRPYYISRRNDHLDGKAISNNMNRCAEPNTGTEPLSLPLDNCEKYNVMRTINALNLSYALTPNIDNQLCELGVRISRNSNSNRITLSWGNQNLTERFFWRGIKKRADQIEGIYAILLNEQDQVQQTQYYDAHNAFDLRSLNDLLRNAIDSSRIFLASNANRTTHPPALASAWPQILGDQDIAYAELSTAGLTPIVLNNTIKFNSDFMPLHCQKRRAENTQ